jgi:hypothetical protein
VSTDSYFGGLMASDMNRCRPIMPSKALAFVISQIKLTVPSEFQEGPSPELCMDLEQLQVADYSRFEGVTDQQRDTLAALHSQAPVQTEEMVFLALRSLFDLVWPEPGSNADVLRAAVWGTALNRVLRRCAFELRERFNATDALLPYWGRRAFLSAMDRIPEDVRSSFVLLAPDKVTCALIKRSSFNATTIALDGEALVGLNWALEPILKNLNRVVLHYFHTQQAAGPQRVSRAWRALAPTVGFFWSDTPASALPDDTSAFFDERAARLAKILTDDQIEFVLSHELGHVALDHPRKVRAAQSGGQDVTSLRHEFEFDADQFAFLTLHARMRVAASAEGSSVEDYFASHTLPSGTFQPDTKLDATHLLFQYMDFVDRVGFLIRDRMGPTIRMRESRGTHPPASERRKRLQEELQCGVEHVTPLTRYGEALLGDVYENAKGLGDAELVDGISRR